MRDCGNYMYFSVFVTIAHKLQLVDGLVINYA